MEVKNQAKLVRRTKVMSSLVGLGVFIYVLKTTPGFSLLELGKGLLLGTIAGFAFAFVIYLTMSERYRAEE